MRLLSFVFLLTMLISCSKKEVIVLVEQPSEKSLDNVNLNLSVNDKKVNLKLKYSKITPNFSTYEFETNNDSINLSVNILDRIFTYKINYPNEKYIIISPYLHKDGKIAIGILKSSEKFNLQ